MFEVGMSALVLKICSEYAKSLGLNFPPCTQQEINAICEWVDKHTIKDMTISQDGYNVTFTFKTENDTTKEFTFTIPKKVDIDELEKVLKGSDSVVVDRLADNSGLQVRLAQSVINDINSKLTKPANPTSDSVVTMNASGTVGTKLLSEIGGGGKLYVHNIRAYFQNEGDEYILNFKIYSSSYKTFTRADIISKLSSPNHASHNYVFVTFYNNTIHNVSEYVGDIAVPLSRQILKIRCTKVTEDEVATSSFATLQLIIGDNIALTIEDDVIDL